MCEISPFCFVTNFLTLKDICVVECTCKYIETDIDLWEYFFQYHKMKLCEYDRCHLEHLKTIFYNDPRRAIKSYYVRKIWEKTTLYEQTQYLCVTTIIRLYLISAWARYGKNVVKELSYQLNREIRGAAHIRWLVPFHDVLKGKGNNFFRRNYLPVY